MLRKEGTHLIWAKKLSLGRGSKISEQQGPACLFRMRCGTVPLFLWLT